MGALFPRSEACLWKEVIVIEGLAIAKLSAAKHRKNGAVYQGLIVEGA